MTGGLLIPNFARSELSPRLPQMMTTKSMTRDSKVGFCSVCGILRQDVNGVPETDCRCTAERTHRPGCMYVQAVGAPIGFPCMHGRDACISCDCTCEQEPKVLTRDEDAVMEIKVAPKFSIPKSIYAVVAPDGRVYCSTLLENAVFRSMEPEWQGSQVVRYTTAAPS